MKKKGYGGGGKNERTNFEPNLLGPSECYQAFPADNVPKLGPQNLANLSSYCQHVRSNPHEKVVFKKINGRERVFLQEHYAARRYLPLPPSLEKKIYSHNLNSGSCVVWYLTIQACK